MFEVILTVAAGIFAFLISALLKWIFHPALKKKLSKELDKPDEFITPDKKT
jgi:hypothetical protein